MPLKPLEQTGVPYTRTRVIVMNGIEVDSIIFSHQFARHTDNREIEDALGMWRAEGLVERIQNLFE